MKIADRYSLLSFIVAAQLLLVSGCIVNGRTSPNLKAACNNSQPLQNGEEKLATEILERYGAKITKDNSGKIVAVEFDSDRNVLVGRFLSKELPNLPSVKEVYFASTDIGLHGIYYIPTRFPNAELVDLRIGSLDPDDLLVLNKMVALKEVHLIAETQCTAALFKGILGEKAKINLGNRAGVKGGSQRLP